MADVYWYQFRHSEAANYYVCAIQVWIQLLPTHHVMITQTSSRFVKMLNSMYTSSQALAIFAEKLQQVNIPSSDITLILKNLGCEPYN